MRTSNAMIAIALVLVLQVTSIYGQNACTALAVATCSPYTCVQTDNVFSCLCPNMQLASSAAACNAISPTTLSPVVIPNQCANAICPAGATCIPTNQNPALYICLCPNNIIANPDCPLNPLPANPCLQSNACANGGTCVVNPLTLQAVCVCPANTYGPRCSNACRPACDSNWSDRFFRTLPSLYFCSSHVLGATMEVDVPMPTVKPTVHVRKTTVVDVANFDTIVTTTCTCTVTHRTANKRTLRSSMKIPNQNSLIS